MYYNIINPKEIKLKSFKDYIQSAGTEQKDEHLSENIIDKFANHKHAKTMAEEATKFLMKKHKKSKQEIMDALKAGDKSVIDQYAKLIATGLSALENI